MSILHFSLTQRSGEKAIIQGSLKDVLGLQFYSMVKQSHKMQVEEELAADRIKRQGKWTESIAVGSKDFVDRVKFKLGGRANGRKVQGDETGWQLREPSETYIVLLEDEKDYIGSKNDYIWKNDAI